MEKGNLFASSRYSKKTDLRYFSNLTKKEVKRPDLTLGQYSLEAKNSNGCTLFKNISFVERIIYDTIYINIPIYDNSEKAFSVSDLQNISSRLKIVDKEDPCDKHEKVFVFKNKAISNISELICTPNPNNGTFNVSIPTSIPLEDSKLYLIDQLGDIKNTFEVTSTFLHLTTNVESGVYYLVLVNENKNISYKKIIVN
ncbi:MAG: T9SS type A sorting domain-containing protein [Saprospiraceae bacterium]